MPKAKHSLGHLDAVHRVLRRKLGAPGTVKETEEALGLYRGYIRYHRHRLEFDLGTLLAILKRLKISPAAFFREVDTELGDIDDPPADPEPEPEPAPDDPPPGAPPDIKPLTARHVLRQLGADLPVYGDYDP